ncbi:nucleoporin-like protein 2, partial [Silurus meridionalis]
NRVWVNPSQRSGGNVNQPSSFSHGGSDWGRGNSGPARDDRSSNFSLNTQNRFSTLNNPQSRYGRTGAGSGGGGGGGSGGGDDVDKQLEVIQNDMEVWQSSGQWIFSCYSILKASITGFVELSQEELRMEYYTSMATGDLQSYANSVQQLVNQWRSRVQELRSMNANTRAAMIAELSNPRTHTSSGGGIFGSSSSSSSGVGASSSSSSGFGASSTSSTGFGASSTGFGASATSSGFSASNPGFGSSSSQPASSQFPSSTPSASTFSFAGPAAAMANKSSAAGFSFSSGSAGGFGGSFTAAGGGGFGSGASVSGNVEEKKSGPDIVYTPREELTEDELREFTAKRFTLGQIPLRPPPADLLNV